MAVPQNLADLANAIDPGVQKYFRKLGNLAEKQYEKYMNVESGIKDRTVVDAGLSGITQFGRVVENAVITAESPVETNARTYTQVEFAGMVRIGRQAFKFGNEKRQLTSQTEILNAAAMQKLEQDCADLVINSASTTYTVTNDPSGNYVRTISGGDAVAAASTAHTREDGGANWSNVISDGTTNNMDYDYDAVQAAWRTARLILDPVGRQMNVRPDVCVVRRGSPNHWRAYEILNASGIPGSNENDANAIKNVMPFSILDLAYLSGDALWAMYDSKMKGQVYGFQLKFSEQLTLHPVDVVYETGELRWKGTMMYDLGHNDARNWVFSDGGNA